MSIEDEVEAVGRIITLIKLYRYQTRDGQDVSQPQSINAYLQQHLSVADYLFWQHLQADGHIFRSPVVDSTLNNLLPLPHFKRLLLRYKRAVYES